MCQLQSISHKLRRFYKTNPWTPNPKFCPTFDSTAFRCRKSFFPFWPSGFRERAGSAQVEGGGGACANMPCWLWHEGRGNVTGANLPPPPPSPTPFFHDSDVVVSWPAATAVAWLRHHVFWKITTGSSFKRSVAPVWARFDEATSSKIPEWARARGLLTNWS